MQNDFTTGQVFNAAVSYVRFGFSVIPLVYGDKRPAIKNWKQYQQVRPSEEILAQPDWFGSEPRNIALILGRVSGNIVVLDFDNEELFHRWKSEFPQIADVTAICRTGRGFHVYFRWSGASLPRNGKCSYQGEYLGEIKSEGGYVVAPPSVHPEGPEYHWVRGLQDGIASIDNLSDIGITIGDASAANRKANDLCQKILEQEIEKVNSALSGERNTQLFKSTAKVARLTIAEKLNEADVREKLLAAAIFSGLTERESVATIESGFRAAHNASPRGLSSVDNSVTNGPEIILTPHEASVVDQAIGALARADILYTRNFDLVEIIWRKPKNNHADAAPIPVIRPMRGARVRELLTSYAVLCKQTQDGDIVPAHPPDWLVPAIRARGVWPQLRPLESTIESPIIRQDGTILREAGYDAQTGLYLATDLRIGDIPNVPTLDDVRQSAQFLLSAISDFPFEKEMHKAGWLAAVLTCLGRHMYSGPSPLFLIDANVRGAGKTLLADTCGLIAIGRELPRTPYTYDVEESTKQITSIALRGDPITLIDNITGDFANAAYDLALTATIWKGRILGTNSSPELALNTVFLATGNNISVKSDTARRTIHIRLTSDSETPEDRKNFRHPDLIAWLKTNRAALITAGLTILRGYHAAGRPSMLDGDSRGFGSFPAWSSVIRNCVK